MKAIIRLTIFVIMLFTTKQSMCQPPFIDSVRIFPSNPTKNDIFRIALHVSTPSPSKTLSVSHSTTTGNISITACYNSDNTAAQMDTLSDTLVIGKLPEGQYQLKIKAYYNLFFTNLYCDNITDSSSLVDSFNVHAPESISLELLSHIAIYPNPASERILVSVPDGWMIEQLILQDINGKILRKTTDNLLEIADLPLGLYLIQVQTNNGKFVHRLARE